ncbi:hypothetical protein QYE76_064920 [Lolium multiflorum]|uniref:Endonuclease/exonuclease/phosphatase domain-containing protein n=1 Tax=Lolium multiflorum TaxID=4521 RepID=A0AAD8S9W9_LOLMU|nr:hypothetical protein QYE76_064920 [Lolium multiflorum]
MCSIFSKHQEPFWAGFGGDGRGFFCSEVAEEELKKPAVNSAIVCIESGELSVEHVEAEFKDLVEEEWDWQVQKISSTDFSLVFPSKESLRMAIRGGGIKLPASQCQAIVMSNTTDPAATEQLVETSVKLFDVPPPFRYSDRLLVGTRELGRPLSVDEASLAVESGPVRMTIGCRAPVQLPDSIMMFVNMQGFRVRVVRERKEVAKGASSPPPPPTHKPSEDEEDETAESDGDRWDGRRGRHASKEPKSQPAKNVGKGSGAGRKSVPLGEGSPRAASEELLSALPVSVLSQYGSNLTKDGYIFPLVAKLMATPAAPAVVSEEESSEDSEQPPISLSLSEQCTPGGGATTGQSYVTPFKAAPLSKEDKEDIAWVEPSMVESEAENLREKERHSKSNNDRPSKILSSSVATVATQLEFTDDSDAAAKLVGDNLQGGNRSWRRRWQGLQGVVPRRWTLPARAPEDKGSRKARCWTVRFGRRRTRTQGRRTLLKEYLRNHHIDVVCLQETVKQEFTDQELRSLEVGEKFFWHWLPATGRSGGMLMGFKDSRFEIGNIDLGQFFLSATVLWRASNLKLEIMGIYGPADHSLSREFLDEISHKFNCSTEPIIMGGDFNLIRSEEDKNNHRINWARLSMFNEAISDWAVREIPRTGARFTWTNKQLNPVRSVLDRVFIDPALEPRFPLCSVVAETSLGS